MSCEDAAQSNVDEFRQSLFWKALLAELVGTAVLVFAGCASCVNPESHVQIALTFGIAVATVVWTIAHVSGGHINPAVTVGMLFARKITLIRALLYVVSQCVGAIVGAAILKGINPPLLKDTLGYTGLQTICSNASDIATCVELGSGTGFGVELVITFVLVFTVFSSCDKRRKDLGGSIPLAIGLSVTLCHLFAIKYTGSSMNPARSFGPAVIGGVWANHWVYWCGPICGGIIAGLLYEIIFAVDASLSKIRDMLSPGGPDDSENDGVDAKEVRIKMTEGSSNAERDYRM